MENLFFNPLVCPISIYRSCVIAPNTPGQTLIKIIIRVAIVTSYVLGRLAVELGFKQLFSSEQF